MGNRNLLRTLTGAALALVLGSISVPATAAVYDVGYDPPDFFGTARFDVADSCLTTGGFHSNDGVSCTVIWLSANVTFREAFPGTRTTSFNYGDLLPDPFVVSNVFVAGGELRGVNSGVIGPEIVSGDPVAIFNGPWWIQFTFSLPSTFAADASGAFGLGTVSLFTGTCRGGECSRNPTPSETADVTFIRRSTVPEPGTLSLLLAALGCGWIGKRRRSAD